MELLSLQWIPNMVELIWIWDCLLGVSHFSPILFFSWPRETLDERPIFHALRYLNP